MAKARFVKKARKARKKHGIKKGDSYWFWKFARCPIIYSLTRPRPSQLVRSEFERSILAAQEGVEDAVKPLDLLDSLPEITGEETNEDQLTSCKPDLLTALESAKDAVEEAGDDCQSKVDSMESSGKFQDDNPTIELLRERAEACERIAEGIQECISFVESASTVEEIVDAVNGIEWGT